MTTVNTINKQPAANQALIYASTGNIDKLKELPKKAWGALAIASAVPEKKFTPMHYAIGKNQWPMVAFLINANCNRHIKSTNGTSAVQLLSKDPESLQKFLHALIERHEEQNLDALVDLLIDDSLLIQRQRVLEDAALCKKIGAHFPKQEALLILCALMVGSFTWKGFDTDFALHLTENTSFTLQSTINCSQVLCYASLLGGMQIDELNEHMTANIAQLSALDLENHQLLKSGQLSDKDQSLVMKAANPQYARNMGLPDKGRVLWNPKKKSSEPIRIFYCETEGGIVHYGLLFSGKGQPLALHLYPENPQHKHFVCEEADFVFRVFKKTDAKIYLSMLPWIK